jgi:outer membrane protein assembly factor BamB
MNTSPVFGNSLGYIIAAPNLYAIDPAKKAVAWTANGTYIGTPSVADGVVYGVSGGNLVARDANLGSLLWTFVGDQALTYPPVVVNGFLYIASDKNVYAVEIATHKQVWTQAVGGWLTVASRRLLVASSDGTLHAFVLSQ